MLIIFSGYLLNLYLGVDKFGVIAGSEIKVPIKVPYLSLTLPINFNLVGLT